MNLGNIAINNLKRRQTKMLFIIVGMVIGIATIVTLFSVTDAMKTDLGDKFDQIGANIVIVPKSDDLSLSYGGMTVSGVSVQARQLTNDVSERILKIPNKENISIIAPKLITETMVENQKSLVVGVNFLPELSLKAWWNVRTVNEPQGTNPPLTPAEKEKIVRKKKSVPKISDGEVILGSFLAQKLGKKAGDTLVIEGQKFTVWGVIDPVGSTVDDSIHMDLAKTQRLFGLEDQLSFIEVAALCTNCPIEDMILQLKFELPETEVTAVREAVKAREATIDKFVSFAKGVSIIILAIGGFIMFLTMMASINERTREIGILRAIGYRKSHITFVILMEALLISLLAGIIGYLVGMITAEVIGPVIAQMDLEVEWSAYYFLQALIAAVIVGGISSVLPALNAANKDPGEALRYI